MAITRTTISLEDGELAELQKLASDKGRSLSNFLVTCALGIDDSSKLPKFEINSVESVQTHLERGVFPPHKLDEIRAASRGVADAIMDYRAAANILGSDFREAVDSREFFPHDVTYPKSRRELSLGLQDSILDEYKRLPDVGSLGTLGDQKSLKSRRFEDSGEDTSVGYHLVRPGLVTRKQMLYLYPFFRPATRRPLWGVIDYAKHDSIGLFINRAMAAEKGLVIDSNTKNVAFSSFGDLIYALAEVEGSKSPRYKIGFREGCFEEEIGEHIWSHAQTSLRYAFEKFRLPVAAKNLQVILDSTQNECGVVIADLSDGRALEQKLYQENWDFVEFRHYADVPVGVGFTLSLLPRLLVHDNWKKIQDTVKTNIDGNEALQAMLGDCGITFEPSKA